MSKIIELEYDEIKHETDKAVLFVFDGKDVWLPKSVIEVDETDKTVQLPEHLAIEREIV